MVPTYFKGSAIKNGLKGLAQFEPMVCRTPLQVAIKAAHLLLHHVLYHHHPLPKSTKPIQTYPNL